MWAANQAGNYSHLRSRPEKPKPVVIKVRMCKFNYVQLVPPGGASSEDVYINEYEDFNLWGI